MPRAPEKACRNGVCPATTTDASGYCAACRPAHHAGDVARRGSAAQRGYGHAWQLRRARVLKREPVCKACMRAFSKEVDHIVPKSQGGTDDETNLQGLCKPCHSSKTAREDGGFGRAAAACADGLLGSAMSDGMGGSNPSTRNAPRPSPAPAREAALLGWGGLDR